MTWQRMKACGRKVALAALALVCALALSCPSALLKTPRSAGEAFADSVTPGVMPVSAQLMWLNPATGSYEPSDPSKALVAGESASFDVRVAYSDGSTRSASDAGLSVSWSLDGDVQGGAKVASLGASGAAATVTLTGSQTKVVRVSAACGTLAVQGSPAFASLSRAVEAPSAGNAVSSVSVGYSSSAGSGSWDPASPGVAPVPGIASEGGALRADAAVELLSADGSRSTLEGAGLGSDLVWQASAFYGVDGARCDTLLADAATRDSQGTLSANRAGDGWAVLKCSSLAHPEFCGQEVPVRIAGNGSGGSAQASTVDSAQLVYRSKGGSWEPYSGNSSNTPTVIDVPFGSVAFDVLLTFADGSTARAGERGIAADWRLSGRVTGDSAIARWLADATLKATHAGNGTVRIRSATVGTKAASGTTAYIVISHNDAGVQPAGTSLGISARSKYWTTPAANPGDSDEWYWRDDDNSGTSRCSRPLVLASEGGGALTTCSLTAQVRWSDSSVTSSQAQDGAVRSWAHAFSVNAGGSLSDPLVMVSDEGVVTPTGAGSGFAYVTCAADVPSYDAAGNRTTTTMTGMIVIAVFKSTSAVDRFVLLDDRGGEVTTSSMVLPSGVSTRQFYVRAVFKDGSAASTCPFAGDYDPAPFSGLEWSVFSSEDRAEEELYSEVSETGLFHARAGFARAYVCATLKNASFAGKDRSCGVLVVSENSIEEVGQVDSLDVKIYHYSDFKNHGGKANPAKEVTLTRSQLAAMADYTTWYSILRRNTISFATWYAHGVTMRNLLSLCGVDKDRLVSMLFSGSDGYAPERHSAEFILGSQYRYTNFYYHAKLPGLMRQESVSPMLALDYYEKTNGGFEDATGDTRIGFADNAGNSGFDHLSSDSTFRVVFGMSGRDVPNARLSVRCVSAISIVVEDGTFAPDDGDPEDEEKDDEEKKDDVEKTKDKDKDKDPKASGGNPGSPGNGTSSGQNPFEGGKRDSGVGTDSKHGTQVAFTAADQAAESGEEDATNDKADDPGAQNGMMLDDVADGDAEKTGELLLREMTERARQVVPPSEIDGVYWAVTGSSVGAALVLGSLLAGLRFRRDRLDGAALAQARKRGLP